MMHHPNTHSLNNLQSRASLPSFERPHGLASKFELPQIELDESNIDFGPIAEGCERHIRLLFRLTNANTILNHQDSACSSLQIEFGTPSDWKVEPYDLDTYVEDCNYKLKAGINNEAVGNKMINQKKPSSFIRNKINEAIRVSKFTKTLSLHADPSSFEDATSQTADKLTFDLVSAYYEFYLRLNTANLTFFKDLVAQLDSSPDKQHQQLDPILVKTNLYYYYNLNCSGPGNSMQTKKYLLNRVEIKVMNFLLIFITAIIKNFNKIFLYWCLKKINLSFNLFF